MRDLLVCDDPIAERRYAYARAAARDGDWAAAAEVLEQALELAPRARALANGGWLAF
jgi:HEPN domain-containing protein